MKTAHSISSISIVGFDTRIKPSTSGSLMLTDNLHQTSSTQSERPFVLSADRYVWPSVFAAEGSEPLVPGLNVNLKYVPETNRFFGAFDLWDNASQMKEAVKDILGPTCGVAFGLTIPDRYETEFVRDSWFDAIYEGTGVSPSNPGSDWPVLGFDVVNSGLTSAISGFSSPEDSEMSRKELGAFTNRFGLLSDQGVSTDFCKTANERYASDGPFFSIALFLLWDETAELSDNRQHLKKTNS